MSHGWIKLYRSLKKHWLFKNAEIFRLWVVLLLEASHQDRSVEFNGELIQLKRGSLVLSKLELSARLAMTRPRLDRMLKKLEQDQVIDQKTNRRFTLMTINNFSQYQEESFINRPAKNQTVDDRATGDTSNGPSNGPTSVHQTPSFHASKVQPTFTNKKAKKVDNGEKEEVPHALEDHFLPMEEDADWKRSRQFTHAGRRPLRKYPAMFLAPDELADVFQQLLAAGIATEQFKLVFKRVAAQLATAEAQGKKVEYISAYNWLTGWAKEEVVRELTAANHLERSRAYLNGGAR